MAYAGLTSHHVNYLIWRYLQESGHGEAAIMLQRAWNPDPQNLPFAPYIKTHALITLVQKGLQYYDLENSLDQACRPAGNLKTEEPIPSFFGPKAMQPHAPPEDGTSAAPPTDADKAPSQPSPATHKPTLEGMTNGHATDGPIQPAPAKARKPEISENGEIPAHPDETPMEIDHHEVAKERTPAPAASPSPSEAVLDADGDIGMHGPSVQEPVTPNYTLTTGQSIGIQIAPAKAADLTPDTTLIDVASEGHVTKTLWRPNDPTTLVAAGEGFSGLWRFSGHPSSTAPKHDSLVESKGSRTCVTALDWNAAGTLLAVATYSDMVGSIVMYNPQGSAIDLLPDVPRMVTEIRWAPRGLQMAVVASDGEHSEVALWDQGVRPDDFLPSQAVKGPVYDVCWSGDDEVYASGDGAVYQFQTNTNIQLSKTFNSENREVPWIFAKATYITGSPVVVAASTQTPAIWVPTHDFGLPAAHHGDITSIQLRPQSQPNSTHKNTLLTLATSSIDETVKIWEIDIESKRISCVHRLYLGPSCPALSSAFSPDGYAVAAATHDKLFIWNAERGGTPMATWDVSNGDSKGDNKQDISMNADEPESSSFDRALSWDSDGKKLALGFGKRMAIVNLQR
ncbi:hypothetical protein AJ80_01764 [Polytolypa hystricis UAMH7299]|uniref:Uncharacterized protein n=1 Tax=Polytolypa hystricis (strain UAMH7299) TaxID=1447883 RepID=A0A2B7YZ78_POLH7|nr:hypothetical protein AJ80_01764 [Polytolypa hystricis UAMH7299]